jgi:hypothetical protein
VIKEDPKWRKFEKLAARIQRELAPDADVREDDVITGVESEVPRKIDISIRKKIGQFDILVVIDCKDHAKKIDVKIVEEFAGMARDVRANKGALISSSGFTVGALTYAKHHGIDTYQLIDAETLDWGDYVSIPAVLIVEGYARHSYRILYPPTLSLDESTLHDIQRVYAADGTFLGSIDDLVRDAWGSKVRKDLFGDQSVFLCENGFIEIGGEKLGPLTIEAAITNERKVYFGNWPARMGGFHDVQSGKAITQEVVTDTLDIEKLSKGDLQFWQEVESESSLAVQPFMSLTILREPGPRKK